MSRIEQPGLYYDMTSDDYFKDCAPSPSLTQSLAKILLDKSPRHAWLASPKLNPRWEPHEDTKFNIGNAAHTMLIGRGKKLEIVEADDWRSNAAKAKRDAAHAEGYVAILSHQYGQAVAMSDAARRQLLNIDGCECMFLAGKGEVVAIAEDHGIHLRTMMDWTEGLTKITDFKTTDRSVAPHMVGSLMASADWAVQAAMQERILDIINPENAGRRHHYFVAQETEEPYALTVSEMTEAEMTIGRQKVERAANIWRMCTASGFFPGYPNKILQPSSPGWAQVRWNERMLEEAGQ